MLSLEGTICFGTLAEGRRDDGFCNDVLLTLLEAYHGDKKMKGIRHIHR